MATAWLLPGGALLVSSRSASLSTALLPLLLSLPLLLFLLSLL